MASVFHRTNVAAAAAVTDPAQLITPANLHGQTEHFAVYLDPALGVDGATDAHEVLTRCEADYASVSRYFGCLATDNPFPL